VNDNEKLYKVYHRNYKSIEELYDDLSDVVINIGFENNKIIIHYNSDILGIEPCRWGYYTYLNGKKESYEWEDQDIYFYALEFVHEQRKDLTVFEMNDTSIVHITDDGITYFDEFGRNHFISFADCAINGPTASCVAERDATKWYFKFYSSSISIKFMFRSLFVFKNKKSVLLGGRLKRFKTLQKLITDSGYTTYDLS
jgi:hypothetical protein